MNKMKKIVFYIIIIVNVLLLNSCSFLYEKEMQAIEYLKQFEQNESVNYVDKLYIYTKDKRISIYDEELLKDSDILFVSKSNIYFSVKIGKNHYEIYKTDYDCSFSEKIFETNNSVIYSMRSEDIIICKNGKTYYKCSIKNDTCEEIDKNDIRNLRSSYYSWEVKIRKVHFGKKIEDFCFTDKNLSS